MITQEANVRATATNAFLTTEMKKNIWARAQPRQQEKIKRW